MLEGSNQIARLQRIATGVYVCGALFGWIAILSGLNLYVLAVTSGTGAILGLTFLGIACAPFLRVARQARGRSTGFSWRYEFWPQQWRIALSWICGFFMYQSFVPILFYFQGAVVAGRMGASLQVYNAASAVASSWVYARGPQMGILGASRKLPELRTIIRNTVVRSTVAAAGCSVLILCGLATLHFFNYKADRFIGLGPLAVLLFTLVILQRTSVETLAVRFQKVEPFVINSIASAALVLVSNVVTSRYWGVPALCTSFALIACVVHAPWIHKIYSSYFARFARPPPAV
jgi:hypothetical protein